MMEYQNLGESGCAVSAFALGTMTFGDKTDEATAFAQLDAFVEAGGTLVDTADVYVDGASETIIGRWLADRPADITERMVLATKGRFPTSAEPNGAGLSRRHLDRALTASLRRLRLETVDLYQVHPRRGDRVLPQRRDTLRQDPILRAVQLPRVADPEDRGHRGFPRARPARDAAIGIQSAVPRDRMGDHACLRVRAARHSDLLAAGRWPPYRQITGKGAPRRQTLGWPTIPWAPTCTAGVTNSAPLPCST